MKRVFAVLALVMFSASVHASKIIGNGGMVVLCQMSSALPGIPKQNPVELLDFYEAEQWHDLTIDTNLPGADYRAMFENLMVRIGTKFPKLAADLRIEAQNFEIHKKIKPGVTLEDTVDSFHSDLPTGCMLKQIAIQIPTNLPIFPRDPWFKISKDLWDILDNLNKTALVLHECLYRIGSRWGVEHSRGVRYLVGLMMSTSFENISDEDWVSGFMETRIQNYEMGNFQLPLFFGNFKACEPAPGKVECAEQISKLKPAYVNYQYGTLTSISYDSAVTAGFVTSQSIDVKVSATSFQFIRTIYGNEVKAEGFLQLTSKATVNTLPVSLRMDGTFRPREGTFVGTLVDASPTAPIPPLDSRGRPVSMSFMDILNQTLELQNNSDINNRRL